MDSLRNDLDPLVQLIVKSENIVDPQVHINVGSQKGDGYVAIGKALDIVGTNKTVNLFLKLAPEGEKVRESGVVRSAFEQEITFYEEIMPSMKRFETENGIQDTFTSVPKCYWSNLEEGKETIAMENLKKVGYELWDRQKVMNPEHIEFVFKEYAKFHGISYAMKRKDPKLFNSLTAKLNDLLYEFMDTIKMIDFIEKMAMKLIDIFDPIEEKEIREWYVDFVENTRQQYCDVLKVDDQHVITHGDCWCNNMLFKYKDFNKITPEAMRLLDFQIVRKGSYAQDLSYCFYTASSKEMIDNYEYYLKLYVKHFNEYVQQYGIDDPLSYEDFLAQWKKYSKHGLFMSIIGIKIMICESEERKDFTDMDDSADMFDCFDFEGKNDAEYRRRVKLIIEHFYKNNFSFSK